MLTGWLLPQLPRVGGRKAPEQCGRKAFPGWCCLAQDGVGLLQLTQPGGITAPAALLPRWSPQ